MSKEESPFTPIDDVETAKRYMKYAQELNPELDCALIDTKIRFKSRAVESTGTKMQIHTPSSAMSAEKLLRAVNETTDRQIDISFKVNEVMIFASLKVVSLDKNTIKLSVIFPVYKLQRRENLRVKIMTDSVCKISFFHPDNTTKELNFTPYDLSVSGFSVLLDEEKAANYIEGMDMTRAQLNFNASKVNVLVKVVNRFKLEGTTSKPQVKVGFSMGKVPPKLESEITRFASQHRQWG